MMSLLIAWAIAATPAFACVQGSYVAINDRLRECSFNVDGTLSYDNDPNSSKLIGYFKKSAGDPALGADISTLTTKNTKVFENDLDVERSHNKFKAELIAKDPKQRQALDRVATRLNEYFGYNHLVAYENEREKAEREKQPLKNPLRDLDRYAEWNRLALPVVGEGCGENQRTAGNLRAVEMVYPAPNEHRQVVLPIALTFEDGAKNHGRVFFIGPEGVVSRTIAQRGDKIFVSTTNKRESEVSLNMAPIDAVVPKPAPTEKRSEACRVVALSQRGDLKAAAAAAPVKTGKAAAAQ